MASSKTNLLVFGGFLLATLLFVSMATATARELADQKPAGGEKHPEHEGGYGGGYNGGHNGGYNGGYNGGGYPGRGGGYNGGYPGHGGGQGYCRWGCCHRGYYGGCRCCSSPSEVPDAEYQAEPGH